MISDEKRRLALTLSICFGVCVNPFSINGVIVRDNDVEVEDNRNKRYKIDKDDFLKIYSYVSSLTED